MPMSMEQRLEILKKAREAKAAKKKESSPMKEDPVETPVETPVEKPVKKTRAKKEPVKTLDLTEDTHEVKDNEINDMLMPSKQEVDEIKKIKETGNPKKIKKEPAPEPEPEVEVEIVYEKAPKKKKKIVRKIIQEESSDDEPEVEIVYEKKPKAKKEKAAPPKKDVPAPPNPFFCY